MFKVGDLVKINNLISVDPHGLTIDLINELGDSAYESVYCVDKVDTDNTFRVTASNLWLDVGDFKLHTKDTNPKDAVGVKKPAMSTVSGPVLQEVGVAMMEGAMKYGRHNYREAGVRYSVYYDAAMRHLIAAFEGQDVDPESGVSHISKAIAGLAVLRDAEINNKLIDDRPPKSNPEHAAMLQEIVDKLFDKYPEHKDAYTQADNPSEF